MPLSPENISDQKRTVSTVHIDGVDHPTVLTYMDTLNAQNFEALVNLFAADGTLKPPFEEPIAGKEKLLRFFTEESQNLKVFPEKGTTDLTDEALTCVKVIGKVQVPWLGGVMVNVGWEFLIDANDKISHVTVKLLASPQELLKLKS